MIRNPRFKDDATRVVYRKDGIKTECSRVIQVVKGKAYLVWEYIVSFIFTKDGFGIQTKDGFIVKCKDQ